MGRGEGVKERRVQNRNVPLEIPAAVSSSRGASAIGRPNWIISRPCPFMGFFETTYV